MKQDPSPTAHLGISGKIAAAFQHNPITALLAILALLLGLFAVAITPKEEEPQIDVTFADIYIPFPGATPAEVENLVTLPAEQLISGLNGLDTLYSFSQPGGALIIAIFEVGVPRNEAIVALYNQIYANLDKLPLGAGVQDPLIKPRGIEDVPVMTLTLWSRDESVTAEALTHVAHGLETELKRIPGTREIATLGQHELVLNVRIDPVRLNAHGITFEDLRGALTSNNRVSSQFSFIQNNQEIALQAGQFLQSAEEVGQLVVALQKGDGGQLQPVYLADVADISLKRATPNANTWHSDSQGDYNAVTLAIGKQAGRNAVEVAEAVMARVAEADNILIPANVEVTVSRNYGKTAQDKSNTLILKLVFATTAVVLLVLLTMGLREALVVGIAIIITLALTLFASWAWGFTLNRVSLFALIFSIGILVDDAIVVVENIHRHMALGKRSLKELIPVAVDEVGGPTILATLTVIAALLPMAFVSGLMGPYMSPIPINASMGMLISLAVAFIVTPWLSAKLLRHLPEQEGKTDTDRQGSRMLLLFTKLMTPFLQGTGARRARSWLALVVMGFIAVALYLPIGQAVVLKMLPFDNKSEFQVMVDMPEGTPLEMTQRLLKELAHYLKGIEEVEHLQLYAGNSAPINFNGLVRHYFLRHSQHLGDIQVNLAPKDQRERSSHAIALTLRPVLQAIGDKYRAKIRVVEVPPGPPVWSPIVAEVYAPNARLRETTAKALLDVFENTSDLVDIDILLPEAQQKWQLTVDRSKASLLGVSHAQVVELIATSVGGEDMSYLHREQQKSPIPIRLELKDEDKVELDQLLNLRLRSAHGGTVALSELVRIHKGQIDADIVHKNMIPMIMLVADMAGPVDSPLYGMFDMVGKLDSADGLAMTQHFINQPTGLGESAVFWQGEWQITYETFRDMGIAYGVGLLAIYLLVVAQFRSYKVPLIIMAPIPLTVIGVMPGHALLGAQFTATSMIGMIALAGIIVRNSILLVDFIQQQLAAGTPMAQAVIHAGAVRAKPILLTALAAMTGALFILDDPIFNGLAISLIFGIFISTLLTLLVIPLLYFAMMKPGIEQSTRQ
jgi:multidrug efflux pump subunit AcrB